MIYFGQLLQLVLKLADKNLRHVLQLHLPGAQFLFHLDT